MSNALKVETSGGSAYALIAAAVKSGNPAKIAAAVATDADLQERAAIKEYDGCMSRGDAELATLLDALAEAAAGL